MEARGKPKGRAVEAGALAEVQALLGERAAPARSADRASAQDPGPVTATFQRRAHRRAGARNETRDDRGVRGRDLLSPLRCRERRRDARRRALTVRVCDSLSCELAGANALIEELKRALGDGVRVIPAPCVGRCEQAPVAVVGQNPVAQATRG